MTSTGLQSRALVHPKFSDTMLYGNDVVRFGLRVIILWIYTGSLRVILPSTSPRTSPLSDTGLTLTLLAALKRGAFLACFAQPFFTAIPGKSEKKRISFLQCPMIRIPKTDLSNLYNFPQSETYTFDIEETLPSVKHRISLPPMSHHIS